MLKDDDFVLGLMDLTIKRQRKKYFSVIIILCNLCISTKGKSSVWI